MDKSKEQAAPSTGLAPSGLEGVVATTSSIGDVDGINGILIYEGYDIHDLVKYSTFEEVVFLLWNGRLPKAAELNALKSDIVRSQHLPEAMLKMLRHFPKDANPMDVLRTAISALAFHNKGVTDLSREGQIKSAMLLTAQMPVIVTAFNRLRQGEEPISPKPDLNIASNFLYMLKGELPTEEDAHIFDVALILHADHELNASTFTCRVVAATLADMYAAVTAAIGALSGPLHGGANAEVMRMLLDIGEVERTEDFIKKALAAKKKIMGFGHRVYRTEDPRATHLRQFSKEIGERTGQIKWYEISRKVEDLVKVEKKLNANVDFYSASTYYMMGIPVDLFTPVFAISRISGWTGHLLEQYANNRLIRPRAEYVGPRNLKYVPLNER